MMLAPKSEVAAEARGCPLPRVTVGSIAHPARRAVIDAERPLGGPLQRFAMFMLEWLERGAQRRHLQGLSDHTLKDMGVSRCDVERERRAGWYDL